MYSHRKRFVYGIPYTYYLIKSHLIKQVRKRYTIRYASFSYWNNIIIVILEIASRESFYECTLVLS